MPPEFVVAIERGGYVGVLIFVIYMMISGKLVPGMFYTDLKMQLMRSQEKVDQLQTLLRASTNTSEKLATRPRRERDRDDEPTV